jgi:sugar phosphate isomerase/epimerase
LHTDPQFHIRQILPHGFESFQLFFWQTLGQNDLARIAAEVKDALGDSGAIISSIELCNNPLASGPAGEQAIRDWEKIIDHAHDFGTDLVCGFTGRVPGCPLPESLPRFRTVFGEETMKGSVQFSLFFSSFQHFESFFFRSTQTRLCT